MFCLAYMKYVVDHIRQKGNLVDILTSGSGLDVILNYPTIFNAMEISSAIILCLLFSIPKLAPACR